MAQDMLRLLILFCALYGLIAICDRIGQAIGRAIGRRYFERKLKRALRARIYQDPSDPISAPVLHYEDEPCRCGVQSDAECARMCLAPDVLNSTDYQLPRRMLHDHDPEGCPACEPGEPCGYHETGDEDPVTQAWMQRYPNCVCGYPGPEEAAHGCCNYDLN